MPNSLWTGFLVAETTTLCVRDGLEAQFYVQSYGRHKSQIMYSELSYRNKVNNNTAFTRLVKSL